MTTPFQSYAQNAEDVVLARALADVAKGTYVDVGAADPVIDNVTYAFYLRGWSGVNIEPDTGAYEQLVAQRPRDKTLKGGVGAARGTLTYHHFAGTGYSTFDAAQAQAMAAKGWTYETREVPVYRLDQVIDRAGLQEIHILKIDVEGFERQVLEGIDLQRIRPWIIVIEATLPGTNRLVESAWSDLLTGRGYRRCLFDGLNVFYCAEERPEIAERLGFPANVLDHYQRAEVARLAEDAALLPIWRGAFEFARHMRGIDLCTPDPRLSARAALPAAGGSPAGALLVDVTRLVHARVITGIERVSLNIVACLTRLERTIGCRLVLVQRVEDLWLQVRPKLVSGDGPDCLELEQTDRPVKIGPGDQLLFTCLDYRLADRANTLRRLKEAGVRMTFWVYDIFPIAQPDWSPPVEAINHARWWNVISECADRIVCDSWKVLVEVREWLAMFPPTRGAQAEPPELRWLHLGADGLDNARVALPDQAEDLEDPVQIPRPQAKTTFLAVASLHPRKAFDQVLDAFDEVWAEGLEVDLVISGVSWAAASPGTLMHRIRTHPRAGTQLHYRGYLPDQEVQRLYRGCDALVYPSYDEGFGLPVVEAAASGMPAVLRDIPVLREVTGRHGFWFSDTGQPSLAAALRKVHAMSPRERRARTRPASALLSWQQVTGHLLDLLGIARPRVQAPRR